MKNLRYKKFTPIVLVAALSLLVSLLTWSVLWAILPSPAPAQAHSDSGATSLPPAAPPAHPLRQTTLSIAKSAQTSISTSGAEVYNGEWITYTLTIAKSGGDVKEIIAEDELPVNQLTNQRVLVDIQCLTEVSQCEIITTTKTITDPRTSQVTKIPEPIKVRWTFSATTALTNTFPLILQFRGRVLCQSEGTQFTNKANLSYKLPDDSQGFAFAFQTGNTTVKPVPLQQSGRFALSAAPNLCTQQGPNVGTSDMDWSDFDNDGDLDVVMVSAGQGVFVYQNQGGGQFKIIQVPHNHPAEGTRWSDFDLDGYQELVLTGEWIFGSSPLPDGGTYSYTGRNYLYHYNPVSGNFTQYDDFNTNDGAWRSAAADFDGNGTPDLALVNYWGGCVLHLFKNNGTGFFNRSDPGSTTDSFCLLGPPYNQTAHSVAWGDMDNDGDPDLAVGFYDWPSNATIIRVFINNAGVLAAGSYIDVENTSTPPANSRYVYSLVWGDYDGDGYFDLAAAFAPGSSPAYLSYYTSGGIRVYHNSNGSSFSQAYSASPAKPVTALDWADLDGDGQLELLTAQRDAAPILYKYQYPTFTPVYTLAMAGKGSILAIRAIDFDNDADLDVVFTNYLADNWLFSATAPFLQQRAIGPLPAFVSHSVTWGDVNLDGYLDALYGKNDADKIYLSSPDRTFSSVNPFSPNPLARAAAWGDIEGDGDLDVALAPNGQNLLYLNQGSGTLGSYPTWIAEPADNTFDIFFADVNQDNQGRLDLLVGNNGNPNRLYMNQGSMLATQPVWESAAATTYDLALGRYDNDILPDVAAADNAQGVRIYRNTGYNSFALAQTLAVSASQAVAWADYDGDGDMDLAVGRYGRPVQLYQNSGGGLSLVWTAPLTRNTTSLAWGDWDNNGAPDLAVGNDNEQDQVYANLGSTPTQVNLVWLWEALREPGVTYKTTALAWVDYDGDGDLDLSRSQDSTTNPNGIYVNTYAAPAHIRPDFAIAGYIPLPRNPAYLAISPPDRPNHIFKRTVLTNPLSLAVPITVTFFDPDTSRAFNTNLSGSQLKVTDYEYSLNGGGQWYPATVTPTLNVVTPTRLGAVYATSWQAGSDINANTPNMAVSDEVLFRVSVIQQNKPALAYQVAGPLQRVTASAVSPPFRVRNTSCVWPEGASISIIEPTSSPYTTGQKISFQGRIQSYYSFSEGITYTWDFGGVISTGEVMKHSYSVSGTHVVTLTVSQPPCPNTRPAIATTMVVVYNAGGTGQVYLPLISKNAAVSTTADEAPPATNSQIYGVEASTALPQVTGLTGDTGPTGLTLRWQTATGIDGYRLYRAQLGISPYTRLADLPAAQTTYTDRNATCGYGYFVTVYNSEGESLPSTTSYYSPPCE